MSKIILAKLNDCAGNIKKEWFVYYSYPNPKTGRTKRFKDYKGFSDLETPEQRYQHAKKKIDEINTKLRNGWNPFEQLDVIYIDELEYHNKAKEHGRLKPVKMALEYQVNKFMTHKKFSLEDATVSTYVSKLRKFKKFLELRNLRYIDIHHFDLARAQSFIAWLQKQKLSNKSLNEYTRLLADAFRFIMKKGTYIPWDDIPRYKITTKVAQHYKVPTQQILKKEFSKKDPQLWLVQTCIYYSFIRPKELRFLKLRYIDVLEGTITVPADIAKNDKTLTIVIPEPLLMILHEMNLQQYPQDYYLFTTKGVPGPVHVGKNYFAYRFKKVRDEINLNPDFKLYSWKHTGNVMLARTGASVKDIQLHNRHSSLDQTDRYLASMRAQDSDSLRNNFPVLGE